MRTRSSSPLVLASLAGALLWSHAAGAQDPAPAAPATPEAQPAAPAAPEPAPAEKPAAAPAPEAAAAPAAAPAGEAAPAEAAGPNTDTMVADAEAGSSPVERPGEAYRFIGFRYRGIIVPKFMMNLFGDGGRTVYVHGFGPEFAIRKDGFEYNFSLWYAPYSMKDTPFKASSDGEDAWEIVNSKIKVIYLTADFLWSHDFSPEFALNYGLGAGFGFVFGDLERTQSRPADGLAGDPYTYQKCIGQNNPPPVANGINYCGTDNDHYAGYTEPSWADGGSKPIIFPWLVFQTGFRYKPHRNMVARLDAGFGTSGFFFGIGADYGL
jgi:hypothetical protein